MEGLLQNQQAESLLFLYMLFAMRLCHHAAHGKKFQVYIYMEL